MKLHFLALESPKTTTLGNQNSPHMSWNNLWIAHNKKHSKYLLGCSKSSKSVLSGFLRDTLNKIIKILKHSLPQKQGPCGLIVIQSALRGFQIKSKNPSIYLILTGVTKNWEGMGDFLIERSEIKKSQSKLRQRRSLGLEFVKRA